MIANGRPAFTIEKINERARATQRDMDKAAQMSELFDEHDEVESATVRTHRAFNRGIFIGVVLGATATAVVWTWLGGV